MSPGPRTVVLLGKGDLAIRIAGWFVEATEWDLRAVVPVIPEPQWTGSLLTWAEKADVPAVTTGDWRDLGDESPGRASALGISVFYDRIMPKEFIDRFDRLLNLHNGPLPRYRGVAPINWALKNGEPTHGVTLHEVTPGIDDGPIIAQAMFSIYPDFDEVIDVYRRALDQGWLLFRQTMPILEQIKPRAQDERLATYYSRRDQEALGERMGFRREQDPVSRRPSAPSSPSASRRRGS